MAKRKARTKHKHPWEQEPVVINYDFRPKSYRESPFEIPPNIVGARRDMLLEARRQAELEGLSPELFADRLSPALREQLGSIHPSLMGGEYLPPLDDDTTTIADISLKSTTGDVLIVCATYRDGMYSYEAFDEYPETGGWEVAQQPSPTPLSLRELITLIDTAASPDGAEVGLVEFNWSCEHAGDSLYDRLFFARVYSSYYPQLQLHYELRAQLFGDRELKEAWGDLDEASYGAIPDFDAAASSVADLLHFVNRFVEYMEDRVPPIRVMKILIGALAPRELEFRGFLREVEAEPSFSKAIRDLKRVAQLTREIPLMPGPDWGPYNRLALHLKHLLSNL